MRSMVLPFLFGAICAASVFVNFAHPAATLAAESTAPSVGVGDTVEIDFSQPLDLVVSTGGTQTTILSNVRIIGYTAGAKGIESYFRGRIAIQNRDGRLTFVEPASITTIRTDQRLAESPDGF